MAYVRCYDPYGTSVQFSFISESYRFKIFFLPPFNVFDQFGFSKNPYVQIFRGS